MIDGSKVFDAHMHYIGRFKSRDESLLEYMDRYEIDKAAITTLNQNASLKAFLASSNGNPNDENELERHFQPKQYNHETVRKLVKKHPDRLIGFFWFNPATAEEQDWNVLKTYIEKYGFKGVKTQTFVDQLSIPGDLYSLAEFCIDHDLPLFIHSGSPFFFQNPVRVKSYYDLAKKYEDLKLILGHAAFTMENTINLLYYFRNFSNVYFETSCSIPYGIMTLIKAMGTDRVIYGSDAPAATNPDIEINKIRMLNLNEKITQQVFYDNFNSLIP
ncbi:MAG: amidohydrolase family protein [Promethearchaeia archaeon]